MKYLRKRHDISIAGSKDKKFIIFTNNVNRNYF